MTDGLGGLWGEVVAETGQAHLHLGPPGKGVGQLLDRAGDDVTPAILEKDLTPLVQHEEAGKLEVVDEVVAGGVGPGVPGVDDVYLGHAGIDVHR